MSLPIKKIYVDTKYKSAGSVSNSNFKIDLPSSLTFPENTAFYIDDVCIPHSWHVIEANVNDKIYITIRPETLDADSSGIGWRIVKIESGNYTGPDLALEIQTKINASFNIPVFISIPLIKVSYNAKRNNLVFETGYYDWMFKIMTPADIFSSLNNTWYGASYDIHKPDDMNEVLGNLEGNSIWYNRLTPYNSDFLNLQPIRNIYIHSSLGNYNTFGPRGETSIVKKIPVTANTNEVIFDQVLVSNDFGDCSKQTVRAISFELKDVRGNYVNFRGANLSFSIIFSKLDVSG